MLARRLSVVPVAGEGRVVALDGVRGIAVALVVAGHAFSAHHVKGVTNVLLTPFTDGDLGVLIFFVLSGYLITGILCREHERAGRISLRDFYVRRALRIWPAFYVYLATVAVLSIAFGLGVSGGEFAAAALYVWNYFPGSGADAWWLGHTWSLAVEEQFYLLWPAALVLLGVRRALWVAIAIVALDPLVRVGEYLLAPSTRDHIPVYFHTRADSLLTGSALALLPYVLPRVQRSLRSLVSRNDVQLAALAVLILSPYAAAHARGTFLLPVGWSLQNLAVAALILRSAGGRTRLGSALAWRPLVVLGVISYSVYLWQQLFLTRLDTPLSHNLLLELACTLAAAYASYRLIELPFLRLKRRFERVPPAAHQPREQPVSASP